MRLGQSAICAAIAVAVCMLLSCATPGNASSYSEATLYSFCSQPDCSDGGRPVAGLISDGAGNLYGTTPQTFSAYDGGTVFELSPNADGTWTFHDLYSFCEAESRHCDASYPVSDLIIDVDGNLYGTTAKGNHDAGSVFELMPNAGRTAWTFKVLHKFCASGCRTPDGRDPEAGLAYAGQAAGLPYDGVSPLYGTTFGGGSDCCYGTVFEIVPRSGRRFWQERILYAFCQSYGCPDGENPSASLIVDAAGNLYGTATGGGRGHTPWGVVFRLSPKNNGKVWAEKVLHSFCSDTRRCLDGADPRSKLLMDAAGDLFGTTVSGGNPQCHVDDVYGCGTLFKLSFDGSQWHEDVLHAFCTLSNCTDGSRPVAAVSMDAAGNLFGTAGTGGKNSYGTIFEFSTSGLQTIYDFCSQGGCADGATPESDLLLDPSGNIFGTANLDGAYGFPGGGTVFELTPQSFAHKKPRGT